MPYTLDVNVPEPIMLIDTHIGNDEDEGQGIDGSEFLKELLYLDSLGKQRIQIWINSPGGVITDGMSIYQAILKTKTKVDTYCIGMAASIAAVIFQAGRRRIMADFGLLMFHNPEGGDQKSLEKFKDAIITMIAERSKRSESDINKMMNKVTWLTADECLENGMCDEVERSSEQNKPRITSMDKKDSKIVWKHYQKITNSLINNQTEIKMKNQIVKMLVAYGITEKSTDAEIEIAINKKMDDEAADKKKLEDANKKAEDAAKKAEESDKKAEDAAKKAEESDGKIRKMEEDIKKMKRKSADVDSDEDKKALLEKCEDLEDRIKKMQDEDEDKKKMTAEDKKRLKNLEDALDEMRKKHEAADKKKNEDEDKHKKAEADDYFKDSKVVAKIGGASNIEVWKNKFVENPEDIKKLIEALPINKAGINITPVIKDEKGNDVRPTNSMTKMAELLAKRQTENQTR